MSFTSVSFLIFLGVFLALYALCPIRLRQYLLLAGSLFFCIWNSVLCALVAVGFALANFLLAAMMEPHGDSARNKLLLGVGIAVDLGVLAVFKVLGKLPLGVSFYTFACFSYLVDVYRGACAAERNPAAFTAYVTMFPKFQMGPIARYGEISPQLPKPKVSFKGIQNGLTLFVLGFCIKILLADKLAVLWNELRTIGFASLSTPLAWLGIASFSLQLYLEWQGYSFMAIGVGRMLGFRIPQNFNYPYLAKSIGDFYRRWHMTLTRWFKDYVYIPLGGNRKGTARTVLNILCVWLLTSVWHGVGWNYLLWGMSIGVLIVLEKLFLGRWLDKLRVLPHIYVLFFIMLTWCCFKITNMADLAAYFSRLFPFFGGEGNVYAGDFARVITRFWPYLLGSVVFCFPLAENLIRRLSRYWPVSLALAVLFWWAVHTMIRQGSNTMMYLNF